MTEAHASLILAVTGVLTLLAGAGIVVPRLLFKTFFGLTTTDANAVTVARHWSLLIALVGALLLYAAYHPEARVPILVVAAAEKFALGLLVFTGPLRKRTLTVAIVAADVIMALLYVLILVRGVAA
jgi:hypothetical protein